MDFFNLVSFLLYPTDVIKGYSAGLQIFLRLVGRSDPWSKKRLVIFCNDWPKHIKLNTVDIGVVYFTYILTQTHVCICILTADDTVYNLSYAAYQKRRPKLVFKTDYRLMQVKCIAECSFRPSFSYHL